MKARENPFSTDRVLAARWRMPEGLTWDSVHARLAAVDGRAAVVGPMGSGKTTFLEALAERLARDGCRVHLMRIREGLWEHPDGTIRSRPRLPRTLGPRDFVLLDNAEVLGPASWLRFRWTMRRAGGLVIAMHREGRLPTLLRCATSPALLAELVEAIAPDEFPRLRPGLRDLFDLHRGNLRRALRELYDLKKG